MMAANWLQLAIYVAVLLLCVRPLGAYMAQVYRGERTLLTPVLGPVERIVYRAAGVRPDSEMTWQVYAGAALLFSGVGFGFLYLLLQVQHLLPLNPQRLGPLSPHLAFNTAASFVSNTDWQSYSGEATLSYLSQMVGLTVQNFVSAGTGMAVLIALVRGLARHGNRGLGNFWVDLTRSILYILLPLAFVLALGLVSQGVVQSLDGYRAVTALEGGTPQVLPMGPAASQIAIKQLGTNGGGFFGANSAHPFENPTPLSSLLEGLAILIIPAALTYTYGCLVTDRRQGWALLAAMTVVFVALAALTIWAEARPNPALAGLPVNQAAGNLEGKELRFGAGGSALWAAATTAASNGSVNSMHESFTPLGSLGPLVLMQLGEVIFGGVGSGLYGMLAFVIIAVFVAGLMVGRTPEYLGKKIETFEMKMAALIVLIPVVTVLAGTAVAVVTPAGLAGLLNRGPQGFSEALYAFSSAGNNNGSAFAGLSANTPFYNMALGIAMLVARFWLIVPTLAIAGSLAAKKRVAAGAGTLPTHSPLFVSWLVGVILLVGALSFLSALALGPVVQELMRGRLF